MKKVLAILLTLLSIISLSTSAYAAGNVDNDLLIKDKSLQLIDKTLIEQPTIELKNIEESETNIASANDIQWDDNMTTDEAIELITNSPKTYEHSTIGEISVDDIVREYYDTYGVLPAANSPTTYTSGEMKTGTPGVYWSVKVTFVLGQRTNGAYYFKSISSGSISIHKKAWLYLWATMVTTTTHDRYHSIIDNGNTIKMQTSIDFTIYTSSSTTPMTYTEKHSTNIPVSYVSP